MRGAIFQRAIIVLGLILWASAANAELMITPTRVVLENRDRSAEITLINRGNEQTTYRISFINMRMTEDGRYEEIKEPDAGQNFADSMIRYSPRQVVLKAKESQVVRLLLRKPANLADGEYRSHLLFRTVPPELKGATVGQQTNDQNFGVNLIPVYGVSIPIIVRNGDLTASASISGASYAEGKVNVTIDRQGSKSLNGEVTVNLGSPDGRQVGVIRNVSVFTPNARRSVSIELEDKNIPAGSTLFIRYRTPQDNGGEVLAEGRLQV